MSLKYLPFGMVQVQSNQNRHWLGHGASMC